MKLILFIALLLQAESFTKIITNPLRLQSRSKTNLRMSLTSDDVKTDLIKYISSATKVNEIVEIELRI